MSEQLVEHLRAAEENNTPVVIVIDPWTMRLQSYAKPMDDLDRNRLATSMVLVVWNDNDEETSQQASVLREDLKKVFRRSYESTEMFRHSIRTTEDLRREITAVLEFMRTKIMKHANPKLPVTTHAGSFPTLKVPESTNVIDEPTNNLAV